MDSSSLTIRAFQKHIFEKYEKVDRAARHAQDVHLVHRGDRRTGHGVQLR